MLRTEKRAPIDVTDHGRVNASLVIASMLLAAAISYVLVVLQPGLVRAIGAFWGRAIAPTNGSPQWAVPAIATGIAIGAASLALLVLSAFVSGVQRAPYLWLSPVLVGFSTLVLSRLPVQLPFTGVSLPLLSVLAGLLLLGGGALVQLHGIAYALSGSLLLLLPGSTLIAGHVVRAGSARLAWAALDTSSALYLFVLLVTSIGVAIVAFVTRPFGAASSSLQSAARLQQQREQLAAAQEQARLLELHLGEAERRAELAEHELRARAFGRREDTADFVTLARPGLGRWLAPFGIALALAAIPLAVYFGVYRPLTLRVAAQQAFAAEAARDHAEEIETLRKRFDAERASALAALTAERGKMAAAPAAAEAAPVEKSAEAAVAQPAAVEKAALAPARVAPTGQSVVAQPKAQLNKVQAPAAVVHRAAKGAKKASAARVVAAKRASAKKPAVAHAKPAEDSADQDPAHALKESVNDDPIGGLDGM